MQHRQFQQSAAKLYSVLPSHTCFVKLTESC